MIQNIERSFFVNIIDVKNLRKNYQSVEAVKGIDFTVKEGSFFSFLF